MENMRQGADESLEVYIARIQELEADLSMASDDPDGEDSVELVSSRCWGTAALDVCRCHVEEGEAETNYSCCQEC